MQEEKATEAHTIVAMSILHLVGGRLSDVEHLSKHDVQDILQRGYFVHHIPKSDYKGGIHEMPVNEATLELINLHKSCIE